MNSLLIGAWIMTFFGAPSPRAAHPDDRLLDFVSIVSPSNPKDENGYGSVPYVYKITRQSVSNETYVKFLNAVDANGSNAKALYNPKMGDTVEGGITMTPSRPTGEKYQVKPGMAKSPVVYVSWPDAARLANWLSNGGQKGSSTEVGAYNLRTSNGKITSRAPGARYAVANQDELYKAAFYLPDGLGTRAGGTDQMYATLAPDGSDVSGDGSIVLPVQRGVISEIVDPFNVTSGRPNWKQPDQQEPTKLSFEGAWDPNREDGRVTFHLVVLQNGEEITDDHADDAQYAGAPPLDQGAFVPNFPFSGGGAGAAVPPLEPTVLTPATPAPSS